MSINRVTLSGNLTRDPDLRSTATGSTILGFGIAVNERVKNGTTGEWEDRPNFVDCTVFGARAESLSRILRKGMKVALEGRLRYSSWEKDGQRRSKLEVIVDQIDLMQRKGDGQGQDSAGGMSERDIKRAAGGNVNYASNYSDDDMFSDDIPF